MHVSVHCLVKSLRVFHVYDDHRLMGKDLPAPNLAHIGHQSFDALQLTTANSSVVPLVVVTQDSIYPVGTAFCVSPSGIWVTARHVLEGRDGAIAIRDRNPKSHIAILWIGSGSKYNVSTYTGGTLQVRSFTRHPDSGTDLALLVTVKKNVEFPALTLSARLPNENTPISGFGYAQIKVGATEERPINRVINIEPNLNVSTGTVLSLYKDGRDTFKDLDGNFTGKLPTVCFETSARFDAGMSGGPVLDPLGAVCGVISTGLDQDSDDEHHSSFVSATPYIFMMKAAFGHNNKQISIYDLAKRGIVPTDRSFERLRVEESEGQTYIYYA